MKKNVIILLGIIAILVGGFFLLRNGSDTGPESSALVPEGDPLDTVFDFYNPFLDLLQSTSTEDFSAFIAAAPELSSNLREQLTNYAPSEDVRDPILCQTNTPERIGTKLISQTDGEAQIMVLSRPKTADIAVVKVVAENGEWKIDAIECSSGEEPPPMGEYSFEHQGQLLKSVPPPLDPNFWYLVYEDGDLEGLTAKLLFDASSMCINGETEYVCDPENFQQTLPVFVQGEASEEGVTVRRMEFE